MRLVKKLLIFICFFLFFLPNEVPAAKSLEITITYGIDGKVQMGKGFPMTLKVTNKGDTLSGDLVIFSSPGYNNAGNIVIPVEFPKDKETELTVSIPGLNEDFYYSSSSQEPSFVKFYENGWEKGKEIPFKGNTKKRPSFFPEQRVVVGALTESPDSLNVLKTAKYNGESVELVTLTKDNLPLDTVGLEMMDVILINDFPISNLTNEQVNALVNWTKAGGHMMIGSNPFIQDSEGLDELILMDINGQESFSELPFLVKDDSENMPNFSKVEINTGDLQENVEVIYSEHSLPMVFQKNIGIGEVTQFAFNLGSETLTKWDGYADWVSDVLQKTVDKDLTGQERYMDSELSYRLGNLVEMYPSSFIPVNTLVILFIVYLILLIPGLYFLLKKLDKREISWIIIPAVAIVSSIAIFAVGAKERIGGVQINNVSVLAIDEEGLANGYGAFSILSNNGGDYPVTIKPEEFHPFPIQRFDYYADSSLDGIAMVEKGRQQSKITFTDVEYWSIRSAMGPISSFETGKLEVDLWVENNQLLGSVSSKFNFDLEDAFILSGSKSYPIGEVKAGETIEVKVDLDTKDIQNIIGAPRSNIASTVVPGYSNMGYGGMTSPKNKESMMEWKQYELLDSSMYFDIQPKRLKQPIIAGFTTVPLTEIELDKKVKKMNSLSVITQGVMIEIRSLENGEFKLGANTIIPDLNIISAHGMIHHNGLIYNENYVDVEPGEYELTYQLPVEMSLDKIAVHKLTVRHPITNGTEFSIFNVKTDEFITLDDNRTTFEENVSDYISDQGKLVIRFTKNRMDNPSVNIPTLDLEGEYIQ